MAASIDVNNTVNATRVGQIRAALDAQRTKVLQLKAQRDQASVLQKDVDNATVAYTAVAARTSQANLESRATQTNVSVLKEATAPGLPSRPRVIVNIAVSLFFALLLSAAFAITRELRDQRLRADDDVPLYLGQLFFGVLPDHRPPRRKVGMQRRLPLGNGAHGMDMTTQPI